MATTRKVLGQVAPSATTDTTLYTVPAATSTVCSSLGVANRGEVTALVRVAVRVAGAALANQQYILYDVAVPPQDTYIGTVGLTLAATDVVTVRASTADVSFSLFGEEAS